MRQSFEQDEEKTSTALVERPDQAPATITEGLEGDFDMSDFLTPRLNLVGKTSKLVSKTVPAGVFVLAKDLIVGDGEDPFRIIVLRLKKEYWEKLPEGSTKRAQVFKTIAEVRAAGGSIDPNDHDSTPFQPCARITCLIESDDEKPGFIFQADGKFYAPAEWFVGGTAYGAVGKKIITDSQLALKDKGLSSQFYEITAIMQSNAKGSWYLPQARLTTDAPAPELLDQVKVLFH